MGGASVVCLLDGDADIFADKYLCDAKSGGRRAANELYEHIENWVVSKVGEEGEHRIFVQIFLNLPGLQSVLGPKCNLAGFVQAFNRSAYPMTMVDTGSTRKGDQAADLALRNHLRFLGPTADYILLGGAHDGGYSHTVLQLGAGGRKKVTLLQTGLFMATELQELQIPVTNFFGLFRAHDPTGPFHPVRSEPASDHGVPTQDSSTSNSSASSSSDQPSSVQSLEELPPGCRALVQALRASNFPVNVLELFERNFWPKVGGSFPFRPCVDQAVALGLIEVGVGGTNLPRKEWIRLSPELRSKESAATTAAAPVPIISHDSPSSATSSSNKAPHPRRPTATARSGPLSTPDFGPLISAIKGQPQTRPLYSQVGGILAPRRSTLYTTFDSYAKAAAAAGLVELGKKEGVLGSEWIALTGVSAQEGAPQPPPPFARFVSLLQAERDKGNPRTPSSIIAEKMKREDPLYLTGFGSYKDFLAAANARGLVQFGGPADGAQWVALP